DESIYYEMKKHSGELPIIGVNTFLAKDGDANAPLKLELIRSTEEEKQTQLRHLDEFKAAHADVSAAALDRLREVALADGNLFAELMQTVRVASLGQITQTLYQVGGQYRRS